MQILYHEHEIILKAISNLRKILSSSDYISAVNKIQWYIGFFREYGDKFHHQKEEDLLFNLLAKKNEHVGGGIVRELTEHHVQFRKSLKEAENFLQNSEWENAKKTLLEYMDDLTDHISAEDDELFVSAEMLLGEEEKENLYFSFLDKDRELSEDLKAEFEKTILKSK